MMKKIERLENRLSEIKEIYSDFLIIMEKFHHAGFTTGFSFSDPVAAEHVKEKLNALSKAILRKDAADD